MRTCMILEKGDLELLLRELEESALDVLRPGGKGLVPQFVVGLVEICRDQEERLRKLEA